MWLYLSGPMRGQPQFNFPLFDSVATALREQGHTVWTPADNDRTVYPDIAEWEGFALGDITKCPEFDFKTAFHWDYARILEADALVMLSGWESSRGARGERWMAEELDMPVYLAVWNFAWELSGSPPAMLGPQVRPW